jgi:sigma-E factor negative regulatory protein RseB
LSPLTVVFCVLFGANLQADERVRHWLQRMDTAISELDYDGHFVYLRGDMLDAMQIRHRVKEGNVREYLISLTGTEREVIRDNNSITIIQSRNGKTHISQRETTGKLSPLPSLKSGELDRSYHMLLGEDMRVAGRSAKVILLQPKDNLRYACRLVLDQVNALPLDVTLFNEEGKQVSRIMFTDLQILYPGEEAADDQVTVESPQELIQMIELVGARTDDTAVSESQETVDLQSVTSWRFDKIPTGYRLKNYHLRNATETRGRMEHFVFSDGLAAVSVYIEPMTTTGVNGEASLGAVNALGAQVGGHKLTIVGEVPIATLKMLLSGASAGAG